MPDLPPDMLRRGRDPDQDFSDEELLFLRFRGDQYSSDTGIGLEAIRVPDLSVNREKHGGRPEYLLVNRDHLLARHRVWGVSEFRVGDIPRELNHQGEYYTFRPVHDPKAHNYFHTEVQCFDSGQQHICAADRFPHDVGMRWRKRLRFKMRISIDPKPLDV